MKTIQQIGAHVRLNGGITVACVVILVFTAGVIALQLVTLERAVRSESETFSKAIAYTAGVGKIDLQAYVEGLHDVYQRDIIVVDRHKRVIADVDAKDVGDTFMHDTGDEIGKTINDGEIRSFVETSVDHPAGIGQLVVPVRSGAAGGPIVGAAIVETSKIREQLLGPMRLQLFAIGASGTIAALLVGFLGLRLSRSIAATGRHIEQLAYRDKLTGLHNRTMFSRLFEHALLASRRYQRRMAIFFIDLDRFKTINDTLGHEAGDELLREMAKRLTACLRDSDVVARLGGDEFVVMLPDIDDAAQVGIVAQNALRAIARSVTIAGQSFNVTASIGISLFPRDGIEERTLMKNADIAMYQAKQDGRNSFAFYTEGIDSHSIERLGFESSVRQALEKGQFAVHYQPKIDCRTGAVDGLEALLRWQHPDLGMVSPTKFIPIAEETGAIVPIGRWVVREVCEQHRAWKAQGHAPLRISVNLSARQFYDPDLLDDVRAILSETAMDPEYLEFEITESMLVRDVAEAGRMLRALKAMGVWLSVDDFGTGYSSLSNLKKFPIDTIKIDRSFVRDLPGSMQDIGITEAIISMGKALGLSVVAEGVETIEQADFLRERDCDQLQGFYFSKAVPAASVAALLGRCAPGHADSEGHRSTPGSA